MSVSNYWHLQQLEGTGQCRRRRLEDAYTWLQQQEPEAIAAPEPDTRYLQTTLLEHWHNHQVMLALLCLRCLVSHAIRQACLKLVNQFGDYYQFQAADLLPYVLDDDGRPVQTYRPLGVHVIETYTPGKASLESWAMHLTRNHSELNQFLIERGLYRVSDWAILNDTKVSQLPKILGEFHGLIEAEIAAAESLLERYHQVYRRDRLSATRPKGRCQTPSEPQLREIDSTGKPQTVLGQLRQLAYWLRQYRVVVRGGTPLVDSLDTLEAPDIPAPQVNESTPQDDFLATYRQAFEAALAGAIADTLRAHCDQLRRKKSPKDQAFLKALALFHCEGMGMKAIAPEVGLTNQVQVTRLMNLKRLRADVRNALLTRLQAQIQDAVLAVTSAERLQLIGDRLDALLAEEADHLIAEAESEAQIPHNRTAHSRFAQQLCTSLHDWLPSA